MSGEHCNEWSASSSVNGCVEVTDVKRVEASN
jgi:hypothetical protein